MLVTIYHLIDDSDRVRYVGQTIHPATRMKQHLAGRSGGIHVSRWVAKELREGRTPRMVIVRRVRLDRWRQAERDEIKRQLRKGANLCNISVGGDDGVKLRPSERFRIALHHLQRTGVKVVSLGELPDPNPRRTAQIAKIRSARYAWKKRCA